MIPLLTGRSGERVWGRADGDVVTIDAETNQISMNVSAEEIAARLKGWKAPRMKVNRGTLAKYTHLVGDASHGVCLLLPICFFSFSSLYYFPESYISDIPYRNIP